MSIDHLNLSGESPLGLLRKVQADARKAYDEAKRERDAASSDVSRAEQSMAIWTTQLNEVAAAISAVTSLGAPLGLGYETADMP